MHKNDSYPAEEPSARRFGRGVGYSAKTCRVRGCLVVRVCGGGRSSVLFEDFARTQTEAMKLVGVLLLSLAALASADTSYQNYQNYQPYDYESSAPSNYYQPARPSRSDGIVGFLRKYFTPSNRRQALLQGFGGVGGIVPLIAVGAVVIVVAGIGLGAVFTNINSSGRGLDTDEWEVDHSVWMEQLQKDFEDSWNTE